METGLAHLNSVGPALFSCGPWPTRPITMRPGHHPAGTALATTVPPSHSTPTCTCHPYPSPPMGYHQCQVPLLLLHSPHHSASRCCSPAPHVVVQPPPVPLYLRQPELPSYTPPPTLMSRASPPVSGVSLRALMPPRLSPSSPAAGRTGHSSRPLRTPSPP
jgi:hypothetical protein